MTTSNSNLYYHKSLFPPEKSQTIKRCLITAVMVHYGLRPQSELILELQTWIFKNVNQKTEEYQNMTLSINKNSLQSFKDPSIQQKDR